MEKFEVKIPMHRVAGFIAALFILTLPIAGLEVMPAETQYKEALSLEKLFLFKQAREVYIGIFDRFQKQVESNPEASLDMLPVAASAVFRLGIVTARDNFYNPYPLMDQLIHFEVAHNRIEKLLIQIEGFRVSHPDQLADFQFNSLFFARAFNRLGWASRLLQGTPWKNYVVFPISDVLNMMQIAVLDLERLLANEGLHYNRQKSFVGKISLWFQQRILNRTMPSSYAGYRAKIKDRLATMPESSIVYKSMVLTNNETDRDLLSRISAKRYFYQANELIGYYYSSSVQRSLASSRSFQTMDQIVSPRNRRLFSIVERMIADMQIK
ncbi:MAG: hypothetical protein ACI9BD_001320 [Candidatus Marinamargulisbacteria bacterium]|jgi:hypothetical protein